MITLCEYLKVSETGLCEAVYRVYELSTGSCQERLPDRKLLPGLKLL